MLPVKSLAAGLILFASLAPETSGNPQAEGPETSTARVSTLRIRLLSTMLATRGIGEWGFCALVETDGKKILFDTGQYPDTVLRNARELGIDLSEVTDVVLSHFHGDHVGGLLALRNELSGHNPAAVSRGRVAKGIFASRRTGGDAEVNAVVSQRYSNRNNCFSEKGALSSIMDCASS